MSRKRNMPSRRAIAEANADLIARLDIGTSEGHETCWACGAKSPPGDGINWLERAHVQALSAGGTDDPANFFLLCQVCHREQPDGAPRDVQEAWLLTHESQVDRIERAARPAFRWFKQEIEGLWITEEEARELADTVSRHDLIGAGGHHASNQSSTLLWSLARRYVDAIRARRGAP